MAQTRDWRTNGVRVIRGNALDANAAQTPGMRRAAAITAATVGAEKIWAGTVTILPHAKTGAHRHGELESVIHVVSGKARMRWGEMGSRWGMNRSVAQIHALLYLSEEPLHADEIGETLGLARSNVSTGLKELLTWNLVQITHVLGDRRDFFAAQQDTWEVIRSIIEGRKRRKIDPTLQALRECVAQLDQDAVTPKAMRDRIETQLEFLETMTNWYDSIKRLPRKTLLKMMRMSERIARVVGD
jgi:DNA-binding transcriptional regulator GbsR (MarR family)